jgi:predicted transcriptional regulator
VKTRKEMMMSTEQKKLELFTLDEIFSDLYNESDRIVLSKLAEHMHISTRDLAKILDVNQSQISRNTVKDNKGIIKQLKSILSSLSMAVYMRPEIETPEDAKRKIHIWFQTPNHAFDDKTPADILTEGKLNSLKHYTDALLRSVLP